MSTQFSTANFNLEALRLNQSFDDTIGVKKVFTRIPIRKPSKTEFFRTRPEPEWRFRTSILDMKQDGEVYVVVAGVSHEVAALLRPVELHVAVDRNNNPFLIPVPLPSADGRRNSWHDSLAIAVNESFISWVRITSNMNLGSYDLHVATGIIPEPIWPDLTFDALLEVAFRGKVIDSPDHPVILQLQGAA